MLSHFVQLKKSFLRIFLKDFYKEFSVVGNESSYDDNEMLFEITLIREKGKIFGRFRARGGSRGDEVRSTRKSLKVICSVFAVMHHSPPHRSRHL